MIIQCFEDELNHLQNYDFDLLHRALECLKEENYQSREFINDEEEISWLDEELEDIKELKEKLLRIQRIQEDE